MRNYHAMKKQAPRSAGNGKATVGSSSSEQRDSGRSQKNWACDVSPATQRLQMVLTMSNRQDTALQLSDRNNEANQLISSAITTGYFGRSVAWTARHL